MYKKLLPLCTRITRPNTDLDMYLHSFGVYGMDELTGPHYDQIDNTHRVIISGHPKDILPYHEGTKVFSSVVSLIEYINDQVDDDFHEDVITHRLYAFDPDGEYKNQLRAIKEITDLPPPPPPFDLLPSSLRTSGVFNISNKWIWNYSHLDHSSESKLLGIYQEILILHSHKLLVAEIINHSPSFDAIQLPLIASCGIHNGGYNGTWTWTESKLAELSMHQLREIYSKVNIVYKKSETSGDS